MIKIIKSCFGITNIDTSESQYLRIFNHFEFEVFSDN